MSFVFVYFFRKRRTSCDVMFSAALMLWLIYHQPTSGDCTNTVITCLSDAAGQRKSRLQPSGLALSTAWKWRRREGRVGLVSAAEHVGAK